MTEQQAEQQAEQPIDFIGRMNVLMAELDGKKFDDEEIDLIMEGVTQARGQTKEHDLEILWRVLWENDNITREQFKARSKMNLTEVIDSKSKDIVARTRALDGLFGLF